MVTADGVSLADHEGPIYYIDGFNVDFIMDKEWGIKRIPDGGFMGNPPELTITGGRVEATLYRLTVASQVKLTPGSSASLDYEGLWKPKRKS